MRSHARLLTIQDTNGVLQEEGDSSHIISFANDSFNVALNGIPLREIVRLGDELCYEVPDSVVDRPRGRFVKADAISLPEMAICLDGEFYNIAVVITRPELRTTTCRVLCEPHGVLTLARSDLFESPRFWPLAVGDRVAIQIDQKNPGHASLAVFHDCPLRYIPMPDDCNNHLYDIDDGRSADYAHNDDALTPNRNAHAYEEDPEAYVDEIGVQSWSNPRSAPAAHPHRQTAEREFIATMMNDLEIRELIQRKYPQLLVRYVNVLCGFGDL